jgi:hypothetical protein
METQANPSAVSSTTTRSQRVEHKHGLDEWSPMMPERSADTVVVGERKPDELYRCQRIGCTEVIRLADEGSEG